MRRMSRGLRYTLIAAASLVVLLAVAVFVLTRTEFGVERTGRFAVDQLRATIQGELEVGRVTSRGLLSGVTLHAVAIRDEQGRRFLSADSARLAYRFRTLVGGALAFDRLILYSPELYIERLPGDTLWNFQRIFPGDSAAVPDTARREDVILIEDATIHDGLVVVRAPWEPEPPVDAADTARVVLEDVPGGRARVWRFEDVDARLPQIVWQDPTQDGQLFRVDEISARAYIWETPIEIERAEGTVAVRDSLVTFQVPTLRLPRSELSLVGWVAGGEPVTFDIEAESEDVAFADLQWLYPPLPDDGGGALRLRMQTRDEGRNVLWLARDARLRTTGTELAGSFGIVTGDTLYFTNVDLEASPLDLDLLREILPGDLPIEGLLIGTVEVDGPISALRTRGDVEFRSPGMRGRGSAVRWEGLVRAEPPYSVGGLVAELRRVDLAQVARYAPELRVRGIATGRVRLDGSARHGLSVDGRVRLERDGLVSTVTSRGRLTVAADRSDFDLFLDAQPISLEVLGEQYPVLERLAGAAEGPVRVTGSLDDLRVVGELRTPAGGIEVNGRLGLNGGVPSYQAEGSVRDFRLDRLIRDLPETRLSGRFDIAGSGERPEDARGRVDLDVTAADVAGVPVHDARLTASFADGLATVDSLRARTAAGDLEARGQFGLIAGAEGELDVRVRADSLTVLEPLVFPDPSADLAGTMAPRLAGSVTAAGRLTGGVQRWRVRGTVEARRVTYDDATLASASADVDWGPDTVAVSATIDSLSGSGRLLPHARTSVAYAAGAGTVTLRARGIGSQELELEGGFSGRSDDLQVRLRHMVLATREGEWRLEDTVSARVAADGVSVDSLTLVRTPDHARIRIAGVLPWRQPDEEEQQVAALAVDLDRVRIGELLRVAQADTVVDGVVSGQFRLSGTALAPVLEGRVQARPFRYGGARLDSVGGVLGYGDRAASVGLTGWRGGRPILRIVGNVPLELALTDREDRLLDRPMSLRMMADSVPAALVAFLAPGFTGLSGWLEGTVDLVGTPVAPELAGELRLSGAAGRFEPLMVDYRDVDLVAAMRGGTLVELSGRLGTANGIAQLRGFLDVTVPADPRFNLNVSARRFEVSGRRDVRVIADGLVHLGGRYTRPEISGQAQVLNAALDLDELLRQVRIVQLDPSLFQLFDTTAVGYRPAAVSPFLANLVVTEATVSADRDVWLRSREMNVEVSGSVDLELDLATEDVRLTGVLDAVRGNYDLQLARGIPARRFEIRDGTIEFVGTPGIDPNLDISAGYRVRRAQGDPLDVVAVLTGTLRTPRVQLTTDSDLPVTQADLASYLLFGRSGAELTQAEQDVLATGFTSGLGLVRPVITGFASNVIHQGVASLLSPLGIPVDYVALRAAEYDLDQYRGLNAGSLFSDTQLEVGIDLFPNTSVVGTVLLAADGVEGGGLLQPRFGARVEYRFLPTWTLEAFMEDRFARTPSFGLGEIDNREIRGFAIFREWGY